MREKGSTGAPIVRVAFETKGAAMQSHVLVVDDDASLCTVLEAELSARNYRVSTARSPEEALARITHGADDVDVLLTDLNMSAMTGVELCRRAIATGRDVPVVVMTAFGALESVIATIRAGAYDYVKKPLDVDDLVRTLDRGVKDRVLRRELHRLRLVADGADRFEGMIGASERMTAMFDLIGRVARSDATVLVTGESGCGKDLVAKAIHARSRRSRGPFVAVNCAAMPENLLESELFGHAKGAFTDAHQSRQGLLVRATGGSLFLDEIGEMPAGMQAKLLRALQERTVRPVGADTEVSFDTRIIAATNRDLEVETSARRFREDLYYRINVVQIAVPPLRDRGSDVLLIAKHVLDACQPGEKRVVGFTTTAIEAMLSCPWRGNVRELQNCIERAVALSQLDHVRVEDLTESLLDCKAPRVPVFHVQGDARTDLAPFAEVEKEYIAHVLKSVGGNKTAAAKVLGFDRRTLHRKLDAAAGRRRPQTTASAAPS
jgi:DNA-binding NtrC family response regulator